MYKGKRMNENGQVTERKKRNIGNNNGRTLYKGRKTQRKENGKK